MKTKKVYGTHCYDDLCLRAQAGDSHAIEDVIKLMRAITGSYLNNRLAHCRIRYDIEDLLQTGMIGVLEGIQKFNPATGVPAESWLLLVAQRKINTELKNMNREKRRVNLFAVSSSIEVDTNLGVSRTLEDLIEDSTDMSEEAIAIITADEMLNKLKPNLTEMEFKVLKLQYAGYSGPAITEKMGIHYKAFDNAVQRVRKKAKKLLGGVS